MINYSIDASVYAVPDASSCGKEQAAAYLNNLAKLRKLLIETRGIRIYIFQKDIRFLHDINLFPDKDNLEKLRQIADYKIDVNRILTGLLNMFREIQSGLSVTGNTQKKYILFENWFKFNKFELDEKARSGIIPSDWVDKITNQKLYGNVLKHASIVAMLNKYVYGDDAKHNLVMDCGRIENNGGSAKCVQATVKKITYRERKDKNDEPLPQNPRYIVPDIPGEKIVLNNANVCILPLVSVNIKHEKFASPGPAFETAKETFAVKNETIRFGQDAEKGISEYIERLDAEKNRLSKTNTRDNKLLIEKIDAVPNVLYAYLEGLNDFAYLVREKEKDAFSNKLYRYAKGSEPCNYCCGSPYCGFANLCKGRIHLLGLNCSDENSFQLESDQRMREERILDDGNGKKQLFRFHLKPNNEHQASSGSFLNLRIYFDFDWDEKKIIIGWIGRHLWLPVSTAPLGQKIEQISGKHP